MTFFIKYVGYIRTNYILNKVVGSKLITSKLQKQIQHNKLTTNNIKFSSLQLLLELIWISKHLVH